MVNFCLAFCSIRDIAAFPRARWLPWPACASPPSRYLIAAGVLMWAGRKRGGSLRDTGSVLVKMTAVVRDEDVARPVHRNAVRALQLARAAARPPKGPHRPPRRGDDHDAVVAPVRDVGLPAQSTATAYGFCSSPAPLPRCPKARAGGASPACMASTLAQGAPPM